MIDLKELQKEVYQNKLVLAVLIHKFLKSKRLIKYILLKSQQKETLHQNMKNLNGLMVS